MLHYTSEIVASRHIKTPTNHIAMDSILHVNFVYSFFSITKSSPRSFHFSRCAKMCVCVFVWVGSFGISTKRGWML